MYDKQLLSVTEGVDISVDTEGKVGSLK